MSLIPDWAPNVHPLLVHFPIVLVVAALGLDLVDVLLRRPAWATTAATLAYLAGAVMAGAAYWTGAQAAAIVYLPGMAHPVLETHRTLALVTLWYAGGLTALRVVVALMGVQATRRRALVYAVLGLVAVGLVQQTAERGARLVYEQGVGVIPAPGS